MSFELAVWHEPDPISREHAENVFRSLRHRTPADPGTPSSGEPGTGASPSGEPGTGAGPRPEGPGDTKAHPGLVAFADRVPGAQWLSPDHLLIGMDAERADEVSAEVFALAAECGLVCYDPQRGLVHNLSPRGVYPAMEMRTGDGMIVVAPDLRLVSDALATMSPQNPFTALVVFGEHFVQTSPEITGYELEYRDSVRDRMFRTHVPDLAAVQEAFIEYATGGRAFLERHDWRLV